MKKYLTSALALIVLAPILSAAVPQTPKMSDYEILLKRSPFVIKKQERTVAPPVNHALTLRGLSKFEDGWHVTVVDRKDLKTKIYLKEGAPANEKGIRLVRVNQNKQDYMKTTVQVMTGGRQLTVGFNPTEIKKGLAKSTKPIAKNPPRQSPSTSARPPVPTAGAKPSTKNNSSSRRPRVPRRPSNSPPPVPRTK